MPPLKLFGGGKSAERPERPGRQERGAPPAPVRHEQPKQRSASENALRAQRLHELAVLSLFLHSAGTMEEMMALFLERSPRVTGAVLTYPLLLDKRRDILTAAPHLSHVDDRGLEEASLASNENFADVEVPLPLRSWHRAVMEGGEVTLIPDLSNVLAGVIGNEACAEVKRAMHITSVAVAPLVMEDHTFGICVFAFSGEAPDVEVLELVAGHCTLALNGLATGEEATRFGGVDQVTWAHGRAYFLETMDAELSRAKRFGRNVGLVLLDLNDFGEFNASYGHTLGDRLLRAAAMALAAPLQPPELVARYGSDEFAILLPESTRYETTRAAQRALETISKLSVFEQGAASGDGVSASLAMVSFPEDGGSRDELLMAAEMALQQAKSRRAPRGLDVEAA